MSSEASSVSLVRELTLLQEREGWLSEAALKELAVRLGLPLHRLESVSTFYTHFRRSPPRPKTIEACRDLSCMLAGGEEARMRLREQLEARDDVELHEVSCLGRCDRAPAAWVADSLVDLSDAAALEGALEGRAGEPPARERTAWAADPYAEPSQHYETLRDVVQREPSELIESLQAAGLRGMGGAGFPTARKWAAVAAEPAAPRYVICNADESEAGTFKDRQILADLPHLVIEGIAVAARCVGAERGWVFIRHEYGPERAVLEAEIQRAYARGALGSNLFGSGFSFDLEVFVSPGGYILGEESALLECMEDRRGEPRNRPPFPASKGLWGQPTLIHNPETLVHAVGIVRNGVGWWNALGRGDFRGHKFVCVSGDVERPQVLLVPVGIPLAEILERCGGVKGGKRLAALAPGGASSLFLRPDRLDTPLDFDAIREAGSMLGTGAIVFLAEGRDLVEVGLNVTRFFARESCGKCVPCRIGTHKAVELVERDGATAQTLGLLEELDTTLSRTSICGLGHVALGPLISLLRESPESS